MTRAEAFAFLKEHLKNQNLIKHSLAVEAIMKKLAQNFGENEENWAQAGLLHDIDYEVTNGQPDRHSLVGAEILEAKGFSGEIVKAVKAHNERHGLARETLLAKTLYCVDPLTGLIVAATLVLPSRKIADLTSANVLNRFKEKTFARGASRETINACLEINLDLEKFIDLGLKAMQEISNELGL